MAIQAKLIILDGRTALTAFVEHKPKTSTASLLMPSLLMPKTVLHVPSDSVPALKAGVASFALGTDLRRKVPLSGWNIFSSQLSSLFPFRLIARLAQHVWRF